MKVPTPVAEREDKLARDLRRGDWIAIPYPAEVLSAHRYIVRSREEVLVVYRDPHYLRPEDERWEGDKRLPMANPDEIPEDEWASGREVDADVDLSVGIPPFVEGHFATGRVDHG
jgi:hypothetical protein